MYSYKSKNVNIYKLLSLSLDNIPDNDNSKLACDQAPGMCLRTDT
ncbi:hypothetical protein FDUTEX481_06899 [Tolypothrix sp. PCC 7601]|nr:hypothetical protein FDUTEX481_06899 [Tolypothrix sp. PCC 7601]